VYKPFFPDIEKPEDVQKSLRVMTQAWGAWMVALPLTIWATL
jgi:hypothetical protein